MVDALIVRHQVGDAGIEALPAGLRVGVFLHVGGGSEAFFARLEHPEAEEIAIERGGRVIGIEEQEAEGGDEPIHLIDEDVFGADINLGLEVGGPVDGFAVAVEEHAEDGCNAGGLAGLAGGGGGTQFESEQGARRRDREIGKQPGEAADGRVICQCRTVRRCWLGDRRWRLRRSLRRGPGRRREDR